MPQLNHLIDFIVCKKQYFITFLLSLFTRQRRQKKINASQASVKRFCGKVKKVNVICLINKRYTWKTEKLSENKLFTKTQREIRNFHIISHREKE